MSKAGQDIGVGLAEWKAAHPLASRSARRISRVCEIVGIAAAAVLLVIAVWDHLAGDDRMTWPCLAAAAVCVLLPFGIQWLLWKLEKGRGAEPPDDPEQPSAPQ